MWTTVFPQPKNLTDYGSWALILTGSASTTCKNLALQLASKGVKILLVGGSPSSLQSTSDEIREIVQQKIEIRTSVVNLNKSSGEEILRRIKDIIKGMDIGIVVNFAADSHKKIFGTIDWEGMQSRMQGNMDAAAANLVIKGFLPILLENKKGAILNVEPRISPTSIIDYLVYQKDTRLRYVDFCDNKDPTVFEFTYDDEPTKKTPAVQEVGVGLVLKIDNDEKEIVAATFRDVFEKIDNEIRELAERSWKCQQNFPHFEDEDWKFLKERKKDEELSLLFSAWTMNSSKII